MGVTKLLGIYCIMSKSLTLHDCRLHAHASVVNSDARGMQQGVQHDTTEIPLFTIIYGASWNQNLA